MPVSRRDALKTILAISATSVAKPGDLLAKAEEALIIEDARQSYPDTSFTEKMYQQEFADTYGDPNDHGTAFHCLNCQGNCAWTVWSKNGKVTRENQSAKYPMINDKTPDFNPRGCNKGAQHSQGMYAADRLTHPQKRVGKRGGGKWKKISWDEAITEIAQNIYATMLAKGPAGNYIHQGAGVIAEGRGAATKRLGTLLGAVRPYIASYVGDMFPGVSLVYGEGNIGCTYDFLYQSKINIFWGCNPNTSRIPDAHFLWEGKYNGSRVIVIAPEFNSTAIHADLWIPIKAGTDGYLAMSLMHVMLEKQLFDKPFVKAYTDLPLLVRKDTLDLLRLADIKVDSTDFDHTLHEVFVQHKNSMHEMEEHDIFLCWNKTNNKLTAMPGSEGSPVETLRLKDRTWDIDPALHGEFSVSLKNGTTIKVIPAFELLKAEVAQFSPQKTQKTTGVYPQVVEDLATEFAKSPIGTITMGFSLGKYFDGMLTQRAISSFSALAGKLGDKGGLSTENEWSISGLEKLSSFAGKYRHRFASGFVSEFMLGGGFDNYNEKYSEKDVQRVTGESKQQHRQSVEEMLKPFANDEGVGKGKSYWTDLETFFIVGDARFRRNKSGYRESFLKKAKFLAYCDIRMSDFATYADILLPAKSHYEVYDLRTNPGYHRYANLCHPPKNLKPIGESKSEWEICVLLVEKIQKIALQKFKTTQDKNHLHIPDPSHTESGFRPMDKLVDLFTQNGAVQTDKQAVEFALDNVDQFRPNTLKTMYKRGGFLVLNEKAGKSSPLYPNKPYSTFENNYYLKQRFETLTGRVTFYVSHPLWIKMGVNVPTAKGNMGHDKFPLALLTPHARWSIHSTYKNSAMLMRLQRGKPYVMINPKVALQRKIKDGGDVKMFNTFANVIAMAKVTPIAPPDGVLMEHGWEPFMFKGKKGHNELVSNMLNLLELSDGWGHLKFGVNWDGNQHAYQTCIQIEKA